LREASRRRGFSAAVYFICDDTEHKRPARIDPLVEEDRVVDAITLASATLQRSIDELEKLRKLREEHSQGGPSVRSIGAR
jgi:hypothetical protein